MITLIRKSALMLVVFIHTHLYLLSYFKPPVPQFLIDFHEHFLGYFHPAAILAAISGYLLFKSDSGHKELHQFMQGKYLKRIKSIIIPYCFWVTAFFIVSNSIIYFFGNNHPGAFANKFHEISFSNYFRSFFFPEIAVAKHLWYLNNLLFAFMLSPLLLILNKNKILILLLLLSIAGYYYYTFYMYDQSYVINYRFIVLFIVGSFFGLNKDNFNYMLNKRTVIAISSIVVFVLANFLIHYSGDKALLFIFNDIFVTSYVFLISFFLLKKFGSGREHIYNRANNFLLYIIHPLIISALCKLLFFSHLVNLSNYVFMLLSAFVLAFVVIKINDLIYLFLNRFFPSFTRRFL